MSKKNELQYVSRHVYQTLVTAMDERMQTMENYIAQMHVKMNEMIEEMNHFNPLATYAFIHAMKTAEMLNIPKYNMNKLVNIEPVASPSWKATNKIATPGMKPWKVRLIKRKAEELKKNGTKAEEIEDDDDETMF